MDLLEFMKLLLNRELTAEEVSLLTCLSPRGMAKLNADLIKEIHPEVTIAELRAVFRAMKARHTEAVQELPAEVLTALSLSPGLSTAELVLYRDSYRSEGDWQLPFPYDGALNKNFDLEDCAESYQLHLIFGEIERRLRAAMSESGCRLQNVDFAMRHLVPMQCPQDLSALAFVEQRKNGSWAIGFSPIALWFNETQTTPLQLSNVEGLLLPSRSMTASTASPAQSPTRDSIDSSMGYPASDLPSPVTSDSAFASREASRVQFPSSLILDPTSADENASQGPRTSDLAVDLALPSSSPCSSLGGKLAKSPISSRKSSAQKQRKVVRFEDGPHPTRKNKFAHRLGQQLKRLVLSCVPRVPTTKPMEFCKPCF